MYPALPVSVSPPEAGVHLTIPVRSMTDCFVTSVLKTLALGVIGYYLLTGEHPIGVDGKLMEVVHRIQTAPVPRPSSRRAGLDADIDAMIGKATARLPQDRYATAADLAADIRRWLAGTSITARELPRAVRVWRWTKRNRVLGGVVAVCLGLLATMGGISVARIIDERDRANALLLETFSQFRQVDGMEELARHRVETAKRLYGQESRLDAITVI